MATPCHQEASSVDRLMLTAPVSRLLPRNTASRLRLSASHSIWHDSPKYRRKAWTVRKRGFESMTAAGLASGFSTKCTRSSPSRNSTRRTPRPTSATSRCTRRGRRSARAGSSARSSRCRPRVTAGACAIALVVLRCGERRIASCRHYNY